MKKVPVLSPFLYLYLYLYLYLSHLPRIANRLLSWSATLVCCYHCCNCNTSPIQFYSATLFTQSIPSFWAFRLSISHHVGSPPTTFNIIPSVFHFGDIVFLAQNIKPKVYFDNPPSHSCVEARDKKATTSVN
jgi:hypothetical protein